MDLQRTNELLEVDFQAQVFQFGTVFAARISIASSHTKCIRRSRQEMPINWSIAIP